MSGENAPLASKVGNCNENGCSTSGIHMSDCNMIDHDFFYMLQNQGEEEIGH